MALVKMAASGRLGSDHAATSPSCLRVSADRPSPLLRGKVVDYANARLFDLPCYSFASISAFRTPKCWLYLYQIRLQVRWLPEVWDTSVRLNGNDELWLLLMDIHPARYLGK